MDTTVGIERERFIVDAATRKIVPAVGVLLPRVQDLSRRQGLPVSLFGYELFAGQIEDRTLPCHSFVELQSALAANDALLNFVASQDSLGFEFCEFAEEHQIAGLEVNPFDQRHSKIWRSISAERRLAASRVAATQVHLAVNETQAVALLNACRNEVIEMLIKIGDHSQGRRIDAYRTMAQSDGVPPQFSNFAELMTYIEKKGGEKNVWDLVRYKPSTKTVEFRAFGATGDINEVLRYVEICLKLLKDAT